ncbi:TauD/TfdA dioxygenase family protein [Hwanghaeella sp.]|uniref:TauD/TfdA dioxygenase family protein n=1 Tax=Hwanghaeella sp. TaxID=2605943 RepID=UPI003CCB9046
MPTNPTTLNGSFGTLIEDVRPADLRDAEFRAEALRLWRDHGGLLALRGAALAGLSPEDLLDWAGVFGAIEVRRAQARDHMMVAGLPVLRIGNTRDGAGRMIAQQSDVPALKSDADMRYDTETRRPVWHTDMGSAVPSIGSVMQCRVTPPTGGETLFADTRTAFAKLEPDVREKLMGLEAVCSQAHHDKKISLYTPGYPVLSPAERAANPPYRHPVVLTHPETGAPALYALNSSTAALVPKGAAVTQAQLDLWELEGVEDESVSFYRNLLPFVTGPDFTVKWQWQEGDIVTWDNRCTLHAATGFDSARHQREMWRVTLNAREGAAQAAA